MLPVIFVFSIYETARASPVASMRPLNCVYQNDAGVAWHFDREKCSIDPKFVSFRVGKTCENSEIFRSEKGAHGR